MKKSLIALAALAASGAAMAQSSVTLYGVVDEAVSYLKGQTSFSGINSGANMTSRFGIRGSEDLGGGLKANFRLESGLNVDVGDGGSGYSGAAAGNGLAFKRNSTVGLSGGFGEVRLGRELTAAYNAVARYDLWGSVGYGQSYLWVNGGGGVNDGAIPNGSAPVTTNQRVGNAITYVTPNIAGFQASANYGFGEVTDNNSAGRYMGLGATYDNGPLSLGLGAERWNSTFGTVNGVPNQQLVAGGPTNTDNMTAWSLGGSFDFGVAKLLAAYRQTDTDNYQGSVNKNKFKGYMLGVSAPVGPGLVRAAYNRYQDKFAGAIDDKIDHFSLGYIYSLSKRTSLYGTYAYFKDKDHTRGAAGSPIVGIANLGNGVALKNNGSEQGLQLGITHTF